MKVLEVARTKNEIKTTVLECQCCSGEGSGGFAFKNALFSKHFLLNLLPFQWFWNVNVALAKVLEVARTKNAIKSTVSECQYCSR